MAGDPYPKTAQVARGERRYHRKVASPKQWQAIAAAKQGPCRVCGAPAPNELHHLAPRAIGGHDLAENIVPLCTGCHARITVNDKQACAALRRSLSDAEYAYANETLGEDRFEAKYPVEWARP